MNPWNARSPKSRMDAFSLNVIHTDAADGWSVAELMWDGRARIGLRWDGDLNNPLDLGNPASHGHGMWFIMPEDMVGKMLAGVERSPAPKPAT
ncbi:MAG: hypothetical protein EOO77_30040 [Oxalobacteraceae bacterium]|nr:MAG: hypothetical protein EOO77_30040 [Oxalobacteraceae bacterium]